jgi:hypothetical protein
MAEEALLAQRASASSASALLKLQEAQLLRAQHRAAQGRLERARAHLQQVTGQLYGSVPDEANAEWQAREYGEWDNLEYWRQEEGRVYNRRRQELSEEKEARPAEKRPRGDRDGPLAHWRHGLVGAVQYWANGSKAEAADLVVSLVGELGLQEDLREQLHSDATREAEMNKFIVDRIAEVLAVNKACKTKEQQEAFLFGLKHVVPLRVKKGDHSGMMTRIAERFELSRGKRSKKHGARPYAFDKCVDERVCRRLGLEPEPAIVPLSHRSPSHCCSLSNCCSLSPHPISVQADWDAAVAKLNEPLKAGEVVLTHNGPAELTRFTEGGGCVVTYRVGEAYTKKSYAKCYGKAPGSARLQRIPPSLKPQPRKQSSLAISDTTRKVVLDQQSIRCSLASGILNARARQQALWKKLKPLLKAAKFAAVQARELWSTEERIHLRPGHFWACQLGDAYGTGSPILHTYTRKNEWFELKIDGEIIGKYRGDEGDCLLAIRRYYNRTADDATGLTFAGWQAKKGERLVVISTELRAVQGRQECDFELHPICLRCKPGKPCPQCTAGKPAQQLRAKLGGASKKQGAQVEVAYDEKQRWGLDAEIDRCTRSFCDGLVLT